VIKITALTDKGKTALQQHIDETRKLKRTERAMQKILGIVHTVVNQDPLTVEIEIRNKRLVSVVKTKHLIQEIDETMENNGASTEDYKVEVV